MAENILLYWGSGSPPCWKVMITLEEKCLSGYQSKLISFANKGHKTEEIMKINPRGQVPTFKDGDVVVNESQAICFYLEQRYHDQGLKLIPDEPKAKALVLQRMFETSNLQSSVVENVIHYTKTTKPEDQDQKMLEGRFLKAKNELMTWDNYMKKNGDDAYIAGPDFTMADIFLFPYMALGVRMGLQLEKFPSLASYYKRVCDRPSIKASWPPHWNEGPGQTLLKSI